MLKLPDIASINPVARIVPVIGVENIGAIAQEIGDRATQFVKGQEYVGQILSKVSDTAYHVRLDGAGLKATVLQMELGPSVQLGQTLSLKYLKAEPTPTFLMAPPPATAVSVGTSAEISSAAQLIGHYLKEAQDSGVSTRYQATAVVTQSPANPQQIAHDLSRAVSKSGLFYESHLSDLVQSNQSLASIKMEPQNQGALTLAPIVSQQLAVLENQRLSWQGEVWPGQKMDLDIHVQNKDVLDEGAKQAAQQKLTDSAEIISSEMTLHLPQLGKVTARLHLNNGRLQVNLAAEQALTLNILKRARQGLAAAIVKNGQQLDALTVVPDGL